MVHIKLLERNDGLLASNCYLMFSENEICVIDPSVSLEKAKEVLHFDLPVKYVILTHAHIDHFYEINSYVKDGALVLVSSEESAALNDANLNCSELVVGKNMGYSGGYQIINDNDIITVGNEKLRVVKTPGHTKGSICLIGTDYIFSGDTLFSGGGYGRYDLPGGNPKDLINSLKFLLSLDENYKLYSGHGNVSTIKETKSFF